MTSIVEDHEHHAASKLPPGQETVPAAAGTPPAQAGHALALFAFGFSVPTIMLLVASFRTNVVVFAAIAVPLATLLVFGAGQYETQLATDALIKTSGWLGLVPAALAIYLACAEVCEFTYGRAIIPLGTLARA